MLHSRCSRTLSARLPLLGALATLLLAGCAGAATLTPEPTIAPAPTPTADPIQALEGHVYVIEADDALYGIEEIHAETSAEGLIVLSEIQFAGSDEIERRTAVLSGALNPSQYTIERVRAGARSYWLGVREESGLACLSSNPDWYGPVFHPELAPSPDVMLEGAPSALPYVLMALRFAGLGLDPTESVLRLQTMDMLEDLPAARPLDLTGAPEQESAVIGTIALQGSYSDQEPRFTLWYEPNRRVLYNVSIPATRWDIWAVRHRPELAGMHRVTIRRVREAPELPSAPTPPGPARQEVNIPTNDDAQLAGTLVLPQGSGPFPCVVLLSVASSQTRWEPGNALAERGWAALSYDPRGLGQSEGRQAPGELETLAADAQAVTAWLAEDDRIASDAIYLVGVAEGAYVATTLMATNADPYAGAILAPYAPEASLQDLARCQIAGALSSYHGWDQSAQERYLNASLGNWQAWLLEGESEIALLGRRISLRGLRQWSQLSIESLWSGTEVPILYMHLVDSPWVCADSLPELDMPNVTVTFVQANLLAQPSPLPEEVADVWIDWASAIRSAP
ncbi:MAG: alpha/beta hydrolase family protein [Anaerolineae bacterium]